MPTESNTWEILAGESVTLSSTIILVSAASAGTIGALRTMAHPDSANFPLVTYNRNPDRTTNFDQVPLAPPASRLLRTLDTTQIFVTPNSIDDVLVTETWVGSDTRASMTAAQFRRMYELAINPPTLVDPEVFLVWSPNDRSIQAYNVVIADIRIGGSSGKLDLKELGSFAAGDLDSVATGIVDRTVEWDLKIVSEAA